MVFYMFQSSTELPPTKCTFINNSLRCKRNQKTVAVRAPAVSSSQHLKTCDDPSEIFLSLWHTHKGFFRAHDNRCTVEPWPLQSQELAIFLCCMWFAALRFELCLVPRMQQMKAGEFFNREFCYMQNTN